MPGVLEAIRRHVDVRPDAVAVEGVGGTYTYAELDRARARTGAALEAAGVEAGQTVAILTSRTTALPGALLGVLGLGARWLLLDPGHPPERVARFAAAADARAVLLCPGAVLPALPAALGSLPRVGPEVLTQRQHDGGAQNDRVARADRRGYLMATSGTTGEPALISTRERPLASFLAWYAARFELGPEDTGAVLSGLVHDALLRDLFVPLSVGGRVYVPEQDLLRDPDRLLGRLDEARVTIAHLTPQLARVLARSGRRMPRLRLIVVAGDKSRSADFDALRELAPAAEIVDGYGTTETPQLHAYGALAALHGVEGSQLLVVDDQGEQAGVGVVGEVLIRSHNLADGYVPGAARADAFGPNPFRADPADRVYRTGDLGRYNPDGSVTLAGRLDHQVKIRGHRVELGEVEAVLRAHPEVVDAVVAAGTDASGELALAAYVQWGEDGGQTSYAQLHDLLADRLPGHAVPATLTALPRLPLTPAGKVDRAALPDPALSDPARAGRPEPDSSRSETERLVARVWREVLGVPRIGPDDSFFALGGHSLSLVAVHARLAPAVDGELTLVDLFSYPTLRSLARYLDGVAGTEPRGRAAQRAAARRNPPHRAALRRPAPADLAQEIR
ncbi:AMP-binding protein [Cryptosporangium sp. NPDC051539]|uniref:non-ribosomal peptide synthetase n=1 Tax=Cryptosporangium sp. NPDC051539 TaxID=3363962 RepID=UPI0037A5117E